MQKAEHMEKLFGLMGRAAQILKTDGQRVEGVVCGVSLEGVSLRCADGEVQVPFTEMEAVQGRLETEKPAKAMETEAGTEGTALENLILQGTAEKLVSCLRNPNFLQKAAIKAEEAAAVLERAQKAKLPWGKDPCAQAFRYRVLLQEAGDPERLEALYQKAIRLDVPTKATAILELLRLYIKKEAYMDAAALFEENEDFLGKEAYAHMTAYATAIAKTKGAEPLEAYLAAHPALLTYSTNEKYFQKLLQKQKEADEAHAEIEREAQSAEASLYEELEAAVERDEAIPPGEKRMDDYKKAAMQSGREEDYLAFYNFLYETGESDAPILAAFMLYSSRIWISAKTREAFKALCHERHPMEVQASLVGAFGEALASLDPEAAIRFLEKWHPLTARGGSDALKVLNREGHDEESPEIVVAMAEAYKMPEAWRRLREFYKYKGIECEGNILYAIAYYSRSMPDLYLLQAFAKENEQKVLEVSAAMLRMDWEVQNTLTVRNACRRMVALGETDTAVPPDAIQSFFGRIAKASSQNSTLAVEILHAGQQFALRRGAVDAFLKVCMPQLKKAPQSVAVFALEAFRICPEEAEVCEKLSHLLEETQDFPGKAATKRLLENPEHAKENDKDRYVSAQLISVMTGLNVRKMYQMIAKALADQSETGLLSAIQGGRVLLESFPGEGLLYEAMYHLLSSWGDEEDAKEIYTMLYQYLAHTKNEPNLFVHYVKRLYCGLIYLERKGIEISGAPKNTEELEHFFDSWNEKEALREEFANFRHRVRMLDNEPKRFLSLLFAGFTGAWKQFMENPGEQSGPSFLATETDMFIHEVGRYNFLRSLASRIVANEPWQQFLGFLTEPERVQIEAVAATGYGEAEKRMAIALLRSKILDKTGSEFLAAEIFAKTSPESFGVLLPVVRTLMLDSVLIDAMREAPRAYLEEATKTVLEQKETMPQQLYNKTYRDFLRAFSNLLFSCGLYKEADPILGLLFTTDERAYRQNPENRYTNLTHAICRQRQKFCKLVWRDPEEVEKFHTTTEYKKLVNIFAVQFASDRQQDWARIVPLMTVLQKRLCAAVYYVIVENFDAFEEQALLIREQNPAMAQVLFYYAERKFRNGRWKAKCQRYLPADQSDEPMYFTSPKEHASVRRLRILDLLELGENPADGAEAGGVLAAPTENDASIRRAIRAEEFMEMSLAKYVLSHTPEAESLQLCREALAAYMNAPTIESGVAVLLAEDFADMESARLRSFYGSFALCIYKEAEKLHDMEACQSFVPDLLTCFAAVSAIGDRDAELLDDVIRSILTGFETFEAYNRYFLKHSGHICKLLKNAGVSPAGAASDIQLYCAVAKNILDMEEGWDGERKLETIRQQNRLITAHEAGEEAFVADLLMKVGDAEEMLREQPLLTIHIDQTKISEGNLLTGYVENSGHAATGNAVLRLTAANGETEEVQMRTIFGDYCAPFAFMLPTEQTESFCGTLCLSYQDHEKERMLTKRVAGIQILPRPTFPLNALPGFAIPVEETEKYFIGRTEEIQSFKNEFYRQAAGEDGSVVFAVRDPKEVPVMVVNGPKRVGKSSLLHRVEKIVEELPRHWVYVHFDAQAVTSLHEAFVKGFAMSWKVDGVPIDEHEAYQKVKPLEPAADQEISILDLGRYYAACRNTFAPGRKILFLIDEVEAVMRHTSPENLFNMLQFAMKNLNDVISFLICGSDDLTNVMFDMENKTQFFQLAKNFPVGKMPQHEYDILLDAFSKRTGLVPDQKAREALWLLTRGQIYYTHMIFNKLVDLYRLRPVLCSRCDMRLYDVYFAFDELQSGSEMFSGLSGMFDTYQSGEKEVIEYIAQYTVTPSDGLRLDWLQNRCKVPDLEKALSRLEARGFIRQQGGRYAMSSEMYRVAFGKYAAATLYFRN